jgi:manganese/zinc/iron transport system substrate-binding protein
MCILFLMVLGIWFAYQRNCKDLTSARFKILCTTTFITDAVKQIVKDKADVIGLMGPGVDPHTYRAKAHDIDALQSADIIFYNGLHLEGKMGELFGHMQTHTVAVAEQIDPAYIKKNAQNIADPHIWHDVSLWILAVTAIEEALKQHDSVNAVFYHNQATKYKKKLKNLDEYVKHTLTTLTDHERILVTAHDAFAYFGDAYNFTVKGLQGISTDAEIGARDLKDLADYITQQQVKTIFVETSIPPRSIQALQQAVVAQGWNVMIGPELYSDALGDKTSPAATYTSMMKYHCDTLVSTLKK